MSRTLRVTHPGGSVSSELTKITDVDSGEDVDCTRVRLEFAVQENVQAEFHLCPGPEVDVLVTVDSLPQYLNGFVDYLLEHWRPNASGEHTSHAQDRTYLVELARAYKAQAVLP